MAWFSRDAHPESQLSAYVDGELDGRARRGVEAHLAGCEACSALADELRQAKSMLAALPRQAPARSFALGPEYAVQRRPEPRGSSFTFAPVAALTVLVALLFVDAADFSGSFSSDDAGSTAGGAPAAERQAESTKGLDSAAPESSQAPQAAGAGTDSSANQTTQAASAPSPNPTTAPPSLDRSTGNADAQDDAFFLPEGASSEADSESGGVSTLRILEIVAALVLLASLAIVYLPRVTRR